MKITKLFSLIAATLLVASVRLVAAPIGVVTNSSAVTVNLTVTTNAPSKTVGTVTTYKIATAKINNASLLALFATWNGTNFPTGARLVIGWDAPYQGDVLVVDTTGTNVLFNASNWSNSANQSCVIDFFFNTGAYTQTYIDASPGYDTWVWYNEGAFTLKDTATSTDLSGFGPSTERFRQNWDSNGNYSSWTDSEMFTLNGAAQTFRGVQQSTLKGQINAGGKGRGQNEFLY